MTSQQPFAGDPLPASGNVIVRVPELRRSFNSMDPSPFRNRDLDPSAEEFDRLAAMPVRIQHAPDESSDAWRDDWPVAPR